MPKLTDKLKRVLLIMAILAVGVFILMMTILLRKPPAKKPKEVLAPLLNGQVVRTEDMKMVVRGFGTVEPKVEVQVVPQVSGRVVSCHKDFVNGGFFKAGEPLITIDQSDYRLAVENTEAAVAADRVYLERELAEAAVARQEWEQLNPDREPANPLVLHEPQIAEAEAKLQASEARLKTAKLNLERTVISMPFDGRVESESVDVGQYVVAGQPVATVYGTDVAEIVVPLEDRDLAWFDLPVGFNDSKSSSSVAGAQVDVVANFAGERHLWAGRVVRAQGRIDSTSRMVNVVVQVADPFEMSNHRPPLTPGMFVEVEIRGKDVEGVIPVPRYAVHNANEVWVAHEGRLRIREVGIARKDKNYAYVTTGLSDGDVIITSSLDTVTDGMKIRSRITDARIDKESDSK
ncbi:MAG TPA: efflux RND transporter periplasmic adaptor subunit [Planctomycetes bacterium]|nr:efflux RND transporter periplasmic adaptor subunit [Planctomycetota bacterium]HIJ69862.1 efflux RND transporter periplasmic adaptor subunit [Planctomycetota bacterium]